MTASSDPRSLYADRLAERRQDIAAAEAAHRRTGNLRLVVVLAGAAMVYIALTYQRLSIAWALVPVALFVVLIVRHERLLRALERRRRAGSYYEKALARLDGRWAGTGETGERYADEAHLYAQDLDLFGRGSLFEYISTARTHIGEDTLAGWLKRPAPPATIAERQQAVEELRAGVDLREALAVVAETARTGVDPVALAAWGEAPTYIDARGLRLLAPAFAVVGGLTAAGAMAGFLAELGAFPFPTSVSLILRDVALLVYLSGAALLYLWRSRYEPVLAGLEEAAHELNLLSSVLTLVEARQFRSPLLARLRSSLDTAGAPPSRRLARLNRLEEWSDSRDNILVRLIEPLLLVPVQLAIAVEEWRRESGTVVRQWLEATGEIEALCSLACYAFEHPRDPFPEFVPGGPLFEAEGLAHPLIPEKRVVANDVRLGGELRVLVVSGSNMSGKSTLLRTIGINAVLAQAGAPVHARKLRLSPLQPGASIRVNDSLQGGMSRFYAEIMRLRDILNATGSDLPVLFLLDEFLHGTNSHDRRVGAHAIVRGLVERGAAGLITTHDLALAGIADNMGDAAANVHFEDHLEDGRMTFDYRMQPGIVRKSNAIELMRAVGLEI